MNEIVFNNNSGDPKKDLYSIKEHNSCLEKQIEELKIKYKAAEELLQSKNEGSLKLEEINKKINESYKLHLNLQKEREEKQKEQIQKINTLQNVISNYEKMIESGQEQLENLKADKAPIDQHLANMETAFSDLHLKYEQAKTIVDKVVKNEKIFKENLTTCDSIIKNLEVRNQTLKSHSDSTVNKANMEINDLKEKLKTEQNRLQTFKKTLDIKISSITASINQKSEEIKALSLLCEEFTGNIPK